ncbi:MAG: Asp-tRNA(Asn)/Glu-tRNA(Gln) amidotransferase subunit GatC [Candidatus Saganbacteria bacterium]|nr:Asp-tRNA(Asn)/Glu-tRNA(Gln) amidotransferase subunit GatC [Candidatus Saganbacteria bacterium]
MHSKVLYNWVMSVSKKDTQYVALLARLGLSEDEEVSFAKQLNDILGYIDIINSADTKTVSPAAHTQLTGSIQEKKTPMRDDKAFPYKDTKKILDIAPHVENNMFRVPRILETEE